MAMQMAMPAAGGCPGGPRVGRVRARGQLATAVPKRFSLRARALAASSSRSFGGAFVTRSSSRCLVMCAISATARSKVSWFVTDGFVAPLTLRTYCNAAAWTSSSVAGGSKLCRTLMFRHMSPGWHTPGRDSSADVTGKVHPSAGVPTNLHHDQPPPRPTSPWRARVPHGGGHEDRFAHRGLHVSGLSVRIREVRDVQTDLHVRLHAGPAPAMARLVVQVGRRGGWSWWRLVVVEVGRHSGGRVNLPCDIGR